MVYPLECLVIFLFYTRPRHRHQTRVQDNRHHNRNLEFGVGDDIVNLSAAVIIYRPHKRNLGLDLTHQNLCVHPLLLLLCEQEIPAKSGGLLVKGGDNHEDEQVHEEEPANQHEKHEQGTQ